MKKSIISFLGCLFSFSVNAQPYTCDDLGYMFDEGGCRDVSSMVRCPMDLSRVWCIGGEMCGLYPVKGVACNEGANIEHCELTINIGQAGKRCKYINDECNACWEKGVKVGNCGTSEKCCKEGWDLVDGKCVEHVCDKVKYPYNTDDYTYADYAGEIQTCKSGNVINFGYKSCNKMWQRASDNSTEVGYYKCLCKRTDYANGYVFPFDKITFYTTFARGKYGDNHMCADAENSYYGYTHCFRGYEMKKSGGNKTGECTTYYSTYCNVTQSVTDVLRLTDEPSKNAVVNGGYKCIYDNICTEENQNYEECSVCKAAAALTKDGKSYIKLCSHAGTYSAGYIDYCPYEDQIFIGNSIWTGKPVSDIGWNVRNNNWAGTCYGECQWGNKNCRLRDMVVKDGVPIGIVGYKSGNSYLVIAYLRNGNKMFNGTNGGWDAANAWTKAYTPDASVCPVGSGCEAGKWRLPTNWSEYYTGCMATAGNFQNAYIVAYAGRFKYSGNSSYPSYIWTGNTSGNNAFAHAIWEGGYIDKNTSLEVYALPVTWMEVK